MRICLLKPHVPYLPEYKSQLQHLFLLLFIKGASYTLNNSISRTDDKLRPQWRVAYNIMLAWLILCTRACSAVQCYAIHTRMVAKRSYE